MADMKKNMNKTTKNNFITYGMVIAIFVVVQILSSTGNLSRLLTGLLVPICVYTIASLSLNLVVGYSGELSLGHAGFMCVGAYSSALFSHVTSDVLPSVPRLILALLVGAAVAAVFGVLIGIPVLRLRGDYLAIVTLAFGEIIKNLINILYVGVDDKGLHVATSAANLKLDPGGKQIIKGALGVSGTATLYKDIKDYFFLIGVILIPILAGLSQFVFSKLTMKTQPQADAAGGASMKSMMYMMPLFSVYIAFIMPAALGVYWIAQSVFSLIQEAVLNKTLSAKMEAEEEARFQARQADRQRRMEEARVQEQQRKQEEQKKKTLREKQQAAQAAKAVKAAKAATSTTEAGRVGDRPYARGRAYKADRYDET